MKLISNLIIITMSKREVKKTVIKYQDFSQNKTNQRQRQRSRQKQTKVEVVDANSRRARLAQMKNRRDEQQILSNTKINQQPIINLAIGKDRVDQINQPDHQIIQQQKGEKKHQNKHKNNEIINNQVENQIESDDENQEDEIDKRVILKPVFISKEDRQQQQSNNKERQEERKKKALRYTTKLLLLQNAKGKQDSQQQLANSSDEQISTNLPDDDDNKNQQLEYELWKIRELKRIRRDREERRLIEKQKAEIERRRKMNNEQILLQNKVMGSDATDNTTQTKYVFMQKYYHKGAFYQDSQDPIFKRDYNLPTPLEMQDKSMLPQILQRRQGNFGKKGQSKYKHLTAEDTTNFDPQFRPDESILAGWKKKMAGYKGTGNANI